MLMPNTTMPTVSELGEPHKIHEEHNRTIRYWRVPGGIVKATGQQNHVFIPASEVRTMAKVLQQEENRE